MESCAKLLVTHAVTPLNGGGSLAHTRAKFANILVRMRDKHISTIHLSKPISHLISILENADEEHIFQLGSNLYATAS